MKKSMMLILVCLLAVFAAACGNGKNRLHIPVEPFQFTDQNGQPFALSDLNGKVWITDVVFTHCMTVCPAMTANMAKLQGKLKEAGVEAELVSFSIDPDKDDPEALRTYLGKFDADFANWHALTGYTFDEIKSFLLKSFKSYISRDTATDQIIHSTSFFLVDRSGTVVAKYDGALDTPYERIIKDIKALDR
ncbi:SCO family protein [Paenibacillus contaminans]|uniref:SCO family protein n=1 Tax=Paenibacillus contaminans TaxID=450362 RepID=A0A329LS20_9BACL|nr:SCO family protein [Paenibacillus contaminans]RAV09403.1 SCO family protein [Paenibacillus contaminans]